MSQIFLQGGAKAPLARKYHTLFTLLDYAKAMTTLTLRIRNVVETNIRFRFPDLQLRPIRESERSAHAAYSSSNGASTCIVMVLGSAKKQEARRDTCQCAILFGECGWEEKPTDSGHSSESGSSDPHVAKRGSKGRFESVDTSSYDLRRNSRNGHQSCLIVICERCNESFDVCWHESKRDDCSCDTWTKLFGESSVKDRCD